MWASKLDNFFCFVVGLFLHFNSISFFFFAFSLPLSFPFFVISCSNLTSFSASFTSDSVSSTRWMLASCISTLFDWSSSHLINSLLIQIQYPSCSVNCQNHLLHGFQLHLIIHIFYHSQRLYLVFTSGFSYYSNPCFLLLFSLTS